MNPANEEALQANRETMVSLAWLQAFGKWVEPEQRRVYRVWTQIRAKYGRVTTEPMVAALTLEFSCNPHKARDLLARTVDVKILAQATDVTDARIKTFSVTLGSVAALNRISSWMPLIDKAIMMQREAEPNDYDAGADLLPPEIYIDTRSDAAKKLLEKALEGRMQKIRHAKKGVEI